MNILFVSSENGALKGGKAGGVGDVVEQLPPALADLGNHVVALTPSHGFLHKTNSEVRLLKNFSFSFRGYEHRANLYEIFPEKKHAGVRHMAIDHPLLESFDPNTGRYRIYTDDPPEVPFQTDANRFALFCAAASAAVVTGLVGDVDLIHLHDWHAALIAFLRQFSPKREILKSIPAVYTIHNLGIQGIRPLRWHDSSLENWFPDIRYDWAKVSDPRWRDCVNPMAIGIRLSDMVHTVSPSYGQEIQQPSRKPEFFGGEGLEADLRRASDEGRLVGILNGCDYDDFRGSPERDFFATISTLKAAVLEWAGTKRGVDAAHFVAYARLLEWERRTNAPETLLTFVGRTVEQKLLLFMADGSDGNPGLESILKLLGKRGLLIVLGSGDPVYEDFLARTSSRHENMVFLNGYSDDCSRALYRSGDLFLMPSSYEPCGLSQLLAMREGQPCAVHRVGGLKDTVEHGKNGFSFEGNTLASQVDGFVKTTIDAISLKFSDPEKWERICRNAAESRFTWGRAARKYMELLYRPAM